MITREIDYALRTILYLSNTYDKRIESEALAEEMNIPYRFLRKIVRHLVSAELVDSARGKNGGIKLALPPEAISLYDVIKAFDYRMVMLNSCLDDNFECQRRDLKCSIHTAIKGVQQKIDSSLKEITFDQV